MGYWKIVTAIFFMGFCLAAVLLGRDAQAIEETKFKVIESEGRFELRQYSAHIVAETFVEGDFSKAGNEAFRRLAGYINGQNWRKQTIPMTAPVSQEADSVKIPMTAPVNQERAGEKWRFTFLMPAEYTLEKLPEPSDSRVELRKMPERLMASLKYSGSWSKSRYEEKKKQLMEWIEKRRLKQIGEPIFARYNSPFTLWFLRRNEVLIPVDRSQN
ncbi:MAG: heme-binding protein [Deltaproteobacteria bacterium]|nr:heme-binding protein [Deltaproteobacteria bacterium]